MTLEAVVKDQASIPEALRAHYTEKDGAFVLDVTGMKTQADFDAYAEALKKRFTDAAADLGKKNQAGLSRDDVLEVVEASLKKFAEAGGGLPGKKTDDKGGGGGGGDGGDPQVAARLHDLERKQAALTTELETAKKERDDALGRSTTTTIRNTLSTEAAKAGVIPDGVEGLVTLIEPAFETAQDGSVVTKLEAGNGVSPNQKPADYLADIARKKEFRMYWPASKGAGADGSGAGGPGTGGDTGKGNPWMKAAWNMTEQGKLYRENKVEAERLMQAAGVQLGAVAPVK